jgi:hypothetical protein
MKGIELPINVLIIIVVAIIVLLAIISMFFTPFTTGSGSVSLETAKEQACRSLVVAYNCGTSTDLDKIIVDNYDANDDLKENQITDTLMSLCVHKFQITTGDTSSCRKLCGCAA